MKRDGDGLCVGFYEKQPIKVKHIKGPIYEDRTYEEHTTLKNNGMKGTPMKNYRTKENHMKGQAHEERTYEEHTT